MATVTCLVTNILQNIFFCGQQKKYFQTGWGWVNGDFHFWVNYPLKLHRQQQIY